MFRFQRLRNQSLAWLGSMGQDMKVVGLKVASGLQ
jgi:hypothetical protein